MDAVKARGSFTFWVTPLRDDGYRDSLPGVGRKGVEIVGRGDGRLLAYLVKHPPFGAHRGPTDNSEPAPNPSASKRLTNCVNVTRILFSYELSKVTPRSTPTNERMSSRGFCQALNTTAPPFLEGEGPAGAEDFVRAPATGRWCIAR